MTLAYLSPALVPLATVTFHITGRHGETGELVSHWVTCYKPASPRSAQEVAEEFAAKLLCGGVATVTQVTGLPGGNTP